MIGSELIVMAIGEYIENVFPEEMEHKLHGEPTKRTLNYIKDVMELTNRIQELEDEDDIEEFIEGYIIPGLDWSDYWDLGEEDLRRDIYLRLYHEYRKFVGKTYNRQADKYLD